MGKMTVSGQTFEVPDDAFGNIPMGPNPYFPDEPEDSTQDQGAAPAESGDAAQAQGEEGSPDPTFDPDTDAANGIDINDPVYQRYQRAFVAKTQTQAPARDLQAELDALKAQQTQKEIGLEAPTSTLPAPESVAFQVDWNDFQVAPAAEDSPIHGVEAEISKQIRQHVEYAVKRVNQQNQDFIAQQRLAQTRDYLTEVVDEIGKVGGPSKKQEALSLLKEYLPIAKADPVKWARFAVASLGITPTAPSAPAAAATQGDQSRVARQVKQAATRPSAPAGHAPVRPPQVKSTRDAVAWALDQQLKR